MGLKYSALTQWSDLRVTEVTTDRELDAIYRAKIGGMTDEDVMKHFSVGRREIEKAVVRRTGTNLNLFSSTRPFAGLAPEGFVLEPTTVWSFKNRGRWATHNGNYRGNWSPYIPRNVILRYSLPGELVLDQFCGAGTTAVEAKLLGRRCIARDINAAAVALAHQNLSFEVAEQDTLEDAADSSQLYEPTVETGDARSLAGIDDGSVDLICTHPPYADIIHYTEGHPDDISFHDVDTFIDDMRTVAGECLRVLKPGGTCAILIGDTRKNRHVVPIGFRTIEAFIDQGFKLKDLVIKRQHNCRTDGFWYSSSIKYNFLLLAQEYLPVFVKPSGKSRRSGTPSAGTQAFSSRRVSVSAPPTVLECKTTWVFPSERFDELTEANLLNRYGNKGNILQVEFGEGTEGSSLDKRHGYDLVYCKSWLGSKRTLRGFSEYVRLVRLFVDQASPLINTGGHLVIRTKDEKAGEETISPALQIWRIQGEDFRLREIIVLAHAPADRAQGQEQGLQIAHEFLLVYQRKTDAA